MRGQFPLAVLASLLAVALLSQGAGAALSLGSRGESVSAVQGYLNALGLLPGPPDGIFGVATREAVRAFQRQAGLVVDGVVGVATLSRLQAAVGGARTIVHRVSRGDTVYGIARRYGASPASVIALNGLTEPRKLRPGQTLVVPARPGTAPELPARPEEGGVELLPWSEADRLFPNGAEARVVDVRTGLAFRVRRIQGTYHADCVPLTVGDTATMKEAYGGVWSWDRHPVVVEIGGRRLAASMNGYPHGTGHRSQNGYPGHFCLHFYGSRTHGSRVVDPDHQAAVLMAACGSEPKLVAGTSGAPPAPVSDANGLRTED